jgi:MFS family permease
MERWRLRTMNQEQATQSILSDLPEAAEPTVSNEHKSWRGWSVVAGLCVMLMVTTGFGFYGLGLYISTLNKELGFSVSAMSGATAVFFVVAGLGGVGVARLLRTVDPRPIVVAGALIAGGALFLLGRVTQLWQVYVVYLIFGIGYAANGLVISTTLVARWFEKQRAVALSIASTGLSFGGVVLTPLARRWLADLPLPTATSRIGLVYVLGAIPATLLLLRPWPARYGLGVDGKPATILADGETAPIRSGLSFESAIKQREFWALTVAFVLCLAAQVGGIAQLFKLSQERIGNDGMAGRAVSLLALCSVSGRLLGSVALPKIGNRRFALGTLLFQSVGITLLAFAQGRTGVYGSVALFGFMLGNVLLLHPLLLASAFGVRDYARVYGRSQLFTMSGVAAGPFIYGWLHDFGGGYRTSYLVGAAISFLGTVIYVKGGGTGHALEETQPVS